MNIEGLNQVACALVASGRGILAADESTGTIKKRFDAIDILPTAENRRDYRELFFRSKGMEYISGVILHDETIWQHAQDASPLVEVIKQAGAIPGIKVDEGSVPLPNHPGEHVTLGLDKLASRLPRYYEQGARFAKWRTIIDIGDGIPTYGCIRTNAHTLARYAALCQAAQVVPIVEPEVLMDGGHDINHCAKVTEWVLKEVFHELFLQRVALEGIVLKPNMVVAGKRCRKLASTEQVAELTLKVLRECVPPAVPGVAFLSGGQSDQDATSHLNALKSMGNLPWQVTFCYARALQQAALERWHGKAAHVPAAQQDFAHRARMNSLASLGQWKLGLEKQVI